MTAAPADLIPICVSRAALAHAGATLDVRKVVGSNPFRSTIKGKTPKGVFPFMVAPLFICAEKRESMTVDIGIPNCLDTSSACRLEAEFTAI